MPKDTNRTPDLFSLKERIALVVGGAGILGEPISRKLADYGSTVIIADTDTEVGSAVATEIGSNAQFKKCDVTVSNEVDALFDEILDDYNQLDILVNATYPRTDSYGLPYEKVTLDDWHEHVAMNLDSCFYICKIAGEIMSGQKNGGSIINFGSIYGVQAPDFTLYNDLDKTSPVEYSAIKGGILNLTRYLASYYGSEGIRVNAVSPGGVYIGQDEDFVNRYEQRTPLNRMAKPIDVCGAVVYLASDASSYVTGHNLIVDGGWTIQ